MPRRSSPSAVLSESSSDRLHTVIDDLADKVGVLTEIVDLIREDLSWLTRNGIPHQPLIVHVHRMPLLSDEKANPGTFEFSLLSPPVRDPTAETLSDDQLRSDVIEQIVERLAEPLGQLAQEQLHLLLNIMDDSHRAIMQAIREPKSNEPSESLPPTPRKRRAKKALATPTAPIDPPPPPGRLF